MPTTPSRIAHLSLALLLAPALGCSPTSRDEVALATQCMRASDDNRAKLSASWLSDAEIEISGDLITVRTEVPAGIGIDATIKFHHWVYRCRKHGEEMEFLGYEAAG